MPWKSSIERYGTVAIASHWVIAIALFGMLATGFRAANMGDGADKAALLRVHVVLGLSVLLLTVLHLAWRFADRKPAPVTGIARWQSFTASSVHRLFYLVILVMAASGIGTLILSGAGAILFAGAPGPLPDFLQYPPRIVHGIVARLLLGLIVLHVGAALYHQFVTRDRLLARMGLGHR